MSRQVLVVPPGGGVILNGGVAITCKVSSADTNGAYTVLELVLAPEQGAPRHIHHREDELFFVVEGTCDIEYEERVNTATQGSVVMLPKGVPHAFRNRGTAKSKIIITAVPGGLDRYFAEIGDALADDEAVAEKIGAINAKYEIEFLADGQA